MGIGNQATLNTEDHVKPVVMEFIRSLFLYSLCPKINVHISFIEE
jgi:hypothetical protein